MKKKAAKATGSSRGRAKSLIGKTSKMSGFSVGVWQEKVWGLTRLVHVDDVAVFDCKLGDRGSYCSLHYHETRSNHFIVMRGAVRVVYGTIFCDKKGGTVIDNWKFGHRDLRAGDSFVVESSVPHQFQVLETGGRMIEVYENDFGLTLDLNDIVRYWSGGKLKTFDPQKISVL